MSIPYRAEIDGLRALAILAVVGYHTFPSLFPGGFIGVDIFFVISGYLITSILITEQDNGKFSIRGFYARRIIRILPALTLVIIASLLAGWFLLIGEEYKSLAKHALGGLGFISNFILWQETGYFDKAAELKPFLNLWSLGIEEQFYIAWPLLLLWLQRTDKRTTRTFLTYTLISFAFSVWAVFYDKEQAFYSPLSRAWELLIGALLALPPKNDAQHKHLNAAWLPALALLTLTISIFTLQSTQPFPGGLALIPVLSCAILIRQTHRQTSSLTHKILKSRPAVWIGLISYPLYLWHWPVLSFSRIIYAQEPPSYVRTLLALTSLVLAYATYKFIEQPAKKLPRPFVITSVFVLIILTSIVATHIVKKDGLERSRHRNIVQMSTKVLEDFIDFEDRGLIKEGTCNLAFIFPDHPQRQICLAQKKELPATALLIGDSHAVHAYWGLANTFDRIGQNLKLTGRGACVPFLDYTSPGNNYECQPHVDRILIAAAHMQDVKTVILVFRGRYIGAQTNYADYEKFLEAMERTIELFVGTGKRLFVILPIVEPGFDPRLCAGTLPMGRPIPKNCIIDHANEQAKTQMITNAWYQTKIKFPQIEIYDPNNAICYNGSCPVIKNGHSMFKDDNHLSYSGSLLIGEQFRTLLEN